MEKRVFIYGLVFEICEIPESKIMLITLYMYPFISKQNLSTLLPISVMGSHRPHKKSKYRNIGRIFQPYMIQGSFHFKFSLPTN